MPDQQFFFLNDTATTEIYTLSLHDALPICIPPEDILAQLDPGPIPVAPTQVAVGMPADLLRRRPDVRRAERLAAAQAEQIGIAESDLYPAISIDGSLGWSAA